MPAARCAACGRRSRKANGFRSTGRLRLPAHPRPAGGRAGAYGAGLIGLAWATPLHQTGWQFGAELLAVAAGDGGVDTRGGAVLQPMLRAGWADGAQRWQLGLGQVRALRGGLNGPVIELSYGAAIGVPRR